MTYNYSCIYYWKKKCVSVGAGQPYFQCSCSGLGFRKTSCCHAKSFHFAARKPKLTATIYLLALFPWIRQPLHTSASVIVKKTCFLLFRRVIVRLKYGNVSRSTFWAEQNIWVVHLDSTCLSSFSLKTDNHDSLLLRVILPE